MKWQNGRRQQAATGGVAGVATVVVLYIETTVFLRAAYAAPEFGVGASVCET